MSEKKQMCEYHMCTEKATTVESSQGRLYNVCKKHKKAINKQKKADNNV